jgi:hypothetical protein
MAETRCDVAAPEGISPFVDDDGRPKLARCAVLFVDLLGVRVMTHGAAAQANLVALEGAIGGTYRSFLRRDTPWPAAMFSDTLVVAAPVADLDDETVLGGLVDQAAWLQQSLVWAGYFIRGAVTLGDFYIRDGFLYGPALVEAYRLENTVAIHPRIILGTSATAALERALAF